MIDPNFMVEVFKTTSTLANPTIPTSTPSHVAPIPTVIPPRPIFEVAGQTGHRTLWVVFAVMFLSTLVFAFLAYRTPVQKRLYHVLTTFITAFATLSYFAMATGSGTSFAHFFVKESHKYVPDTVDHILRQVYWARYVDWSITTPLLLLDLSFLAGLSGANILVAIVADLVMILTGLFAAFGRSDGTKWGWYAMACVAFLVIIYQLAIPGRRAVKARDAGTTKLFASLGLFTLVLWTLYPIVWGIADGARKWSVDSEIIAYAVLDILAKPVFGFWLLFAHGKKADAIEGFWAHGLGREGTIRIQDEES
jgi:bacteriorhodopsin